MWIVTMIMSILFITAFPKVGLTIVGVVLIGILFNKWASRYYFNLFISSLIGYCILDELSKKHIVFKGIYEFIKFLGNTIGLTKWYDSEFLSSLLILSILLTLLDILIRTVYIYILNIIPNKEKINNIKNNIKNKKKNKKDVITNIKKESKKNMQNNEFNDIVFNTYPSNTSEKDI